MVFLNDEIKSSKQSRFGSGLDQFTGLVEVIVDNAFGIDSE